MEHKRAETAPVTLGSNGLQIDKEQANTPNAHAAAQVAVALGMLESRYRENVASYAEVLHKVNHEIEMAKIELTQFKEQKRPYDDDLTQMLKEIDHELKLLEHLTQRWMQDAGVIRELSREMKHLANPGEMADRLAYREENLMALDEEIAALELNLLNHELEKENLQLKIEPIEQKIRSVEKRIAELESEKRYIESAQLHKITQVVSPEENALLEDLKSGKH
ncbi:MAG: hypothetical protein L3J47_02925 [Sulfurovum sp.]|nr:hypothetical protein [Sulfurovum sp.]